MSTVAFIRRMLDAGFSHDDALKAAEAFEATASAPRSKGAERTARWRANKPSQNVTCDAGDALSSPEGSSPTPPSPKPHQSIPPSPPKGGSSPAAKAEFETVFWPIYPNKVGKPDALKAFVRARERVDLETMMAGLRAYVSKTDDRPWCNPSTFLNQDRWNDRPAQVLRREAPRRERTILDVIDERLDLANANIFDALRTIDAEPSRREPSPPDLRLIADASRH
jgi:hypothetical protein